MASRSLLRREEYKHLAEVSIDGRILDVGGAPSADYHPCIKGTHEFVSANIEPSADLVFDAQNVWPVPSASFDAVLFMNILEHLYDHQTAVREARRVLVPGGRVIGAVPFLFNVHSSPDDHFRYTKSTLTRLLTEAGFTEVRVTELGTGAFSVIYHCLIGFMRWQWMADFCMFVCTGLDRLLGKIRPGNKMSNEYFPLGYFFEARVPQK